MGPQKGNTHDLATLNDLDENTLIDELLHRYRKHVIYRTFSADNKTTQNAMVYNTGVEILLKCAYGQGLKMYVKIGDINQENIDTEINIKCTVVQKSSLGTWGKTSSGKKLNGVLCDDTGRLDFISWNEAAVSVDGKLAVGRTYLIEQVRVKQCAPAFSSTQRNLQVNIGDKSVITEEQNGPFTCPLDLVKLKDLRQCQHERVNIAGVISQMKKTEDFGAPLLSVLINDGEADVNVLFWRQAATAFTGRIGDVLHVFGVTVKIYGNYIAVTCPPKNYTINEKHEELKHLASVTSATNVNIHLSPEKTKAQKVKNIDELSQSNKKQEFQATVEYCVANLYNMCPSVNCGKSLYRNEHTDQFTCDKCEKTFLVSATGVCLKVRVKNVSTTACVTLFNNLAEKFTGKKGSDIEKDNISNDELSQCVRGNTYSFTVYGGRKIDEFNCMDFTMLQQSEKAKDEMVTSNQREKFSDRLQKVSEKFDEPPSKINLKNGCTQMQNSVLDRSSPEPSPGTSSSSIGSMSGALYQQEDDTSIKYAFPETSVPYCSAMPFSYTPPTFSSVSTPLTSPVKNVFGFSATCESTDSPMIPASGPYTNASSTVVEKSPIDYLFRRSPKNTLSTTSSGAGHTLSGNTTCQMQNEPVSLYEQMASIWERFPPPVDPPKIQRKKRSFSVADIID